MRIKFKKVLEAPLPRYRKIKDTGLVDLTNCLIGMLKKEGRLRTARAYGSTLRSFLYYLGKEDLPMSSIRTEQIKRYEESLLLKGRSLNTISFYMRNLRSIYNKGVHMGLVRASREELFSHVYTGICQTSKRAADRDDIRRIHDWLEEQQKINACKPDTLSMCGCYFLFCFYARGMSYVDMAYLKKSDLRSGMIRYRRRKTGQLLEVKVTPELKSLLRYFSSFTHNSIYLLPIIRDTSKSRLQYENGLRLQNRHLKELGEKAGVSVPLSTHVARHTWATIARHMHVPLPVISESLGHRSEKTTSIYLASFGSGVLDKANRRVASCIKKLC